MKSTREHLCPECEDKKAAGGRERTGLPGEALSQELPRRDFRAAGNMAMQRWAKGGDRPRGGSTTGGATAVRAGGDGGVADAILHRRRAAGGHQEGTRNPAYEEKSFLHVLIPVGCLALRSRRKFHAHLRANSILRVRIEYSRLRRWRRLIAHAGEGIRNQDNRIGARAGVARRTR